MKTGRSQFPKVQGVPVGRREVLPRLCGPKADLPSHRKVNFGRQGHRPRKCDTQKGETAAPTQVSRNVLMPSSCS